MSQVSKANPTLIGAFILGAIALVALALITLGGAELFKSKQRAVIFFEGSVNGLSVGAPVNFRGVRVGSVDKIVLQFDSTTLVARIPVYITLLPTQIKMMGGVESLKDIPFQTLIDKGMRAKLNMESFVTGQLSVDLDFRPNTPLVLVGSPDSEVPEIPAVKSDFDVLKDQLSQIPFRQLADDVKSLVESISVLTHGADGTLGIVGQELQTTAASARKTLDQATLTLKTLDGTLASVRHTSDQAGATLDVAGPQLAQTLASAQAAMARAEQTMTNADQLMSQASELTAPGAPLRADLEQAMRDLAATAESLRGFASTVERNPNALVFGKDKP